MPGVARMRPAHLAAFSFVLCVAVPATYSQVPSPEQILTQFRPIHRDVEFETPARDDFANCKVEVERGNGTAGFVVYGPAGQVLRRFTDTDGDNKPDLFRYYRMGLEVYRDIDSNNNEKPDQHRWLNWGGMRWGHDPDEDGRIDSWRMLSAQESAQVAVEAMIKRDMHALGSVLINADDVRKIKATSEIGRQLLLSVKDPTVQLQKVLADSKSLTSVSKWVRFDPPVPGLVPKDDGKAAMDLTVYENAMAIIETAGTHQLVSIGEMVKVGDVWKLTQLPKPLDADNAEVQIGGILMQPQLTGGNVNAPPEMAKEMEQLLTQLQKLDENSPTASVTPAGLARYNQQRADIIDKIIRIAPTEQERVQWIEQFADGIAAAVQTGHYDAGLQRLTALQDQVKSSPELLGYVWYRRLLAEYAVRLKTDDEKVQQEAQEWWLKQLEVFAQKWPRSADASDAIVQLAISLELTGRIDDAKRWYGQLVKDHARTNAGIRARGALRRLDLTGKPLQLAGRSLNGQPIDASQYRGKVTLVVFWATWAKPYTDDLPKLIAAHTKYQRSGFEILGVNLDADAGGIQPYLAKNGGTWQHIRVPGGTDGQLAKDFGIVSVPTMFVVDKAGRVAGGVTADNLEQAVVLLLKGQPLDAPSRQGAAGLTPTRN
ncbi:MAG TPA: redoxin domain-containing protein [Planctomycetes bacterium]|nr:redoxin domain-containing protein [Fuerstiella sp.]HIK94462.1 redoxin domain-containing protein [Planctomycetota bacterium]